MLVIILTLIHLVLILLGSTQKEFGIGAADSKEVLLMRLKAFQKI